MATPHSATVHLSARLSGSFKTPPPPAAPRKAAPVAAPAPPAPLPPKPAPPAPPPPPVEMKEAPSTWGDGSAPAGENVVPETAPEAPPTVEPGEEQSPPSPAAPDGALAPVGRKPSNELRIGRRKARLPRTFRRVAAAAVAGELARSASSAAAVPANARKKMGWALDRARTALRARQLERARRARTRDLARAMVDLSTLGRDDAGVRNVDALLKARTPASLLRGAADPVEDSDELHRALRRAREERGLSRVTEREALLGRHLGLLVSEGKDARSVLSSAFRDSALAVVVLTSRTRESVLPALRAARVEGRRVVFVAAEPGLADHARAAARGSNAVVLERLDLLRPGAEGAPDALEVSDLELLLSEAPETRALLENLTRAVTLAFPAGLSVRWTGVRNPYLLAAIPILLAALHAAVVTIEDLERQERSARLISSQA
jgi:hypothetical protein